MTEKKRLLLKFLKNENSTDCEDFYKYLLKLKIE